MNVSEEVLIGYSFSIIHVFGNISFIFHLIGGFINLVWLLTNKWKNCSVIHPQSMMWDSILHVRLPWIWFSVGTTDWFCSQLRSSISEHWIYCLCWCCCCRCRQLGVQLHISKPIKRVVLVRALHLALGIPDSRTIAQVRFVKIWMFESFVLDEWRICVCCAL